MKRRVRSAVPLAAVGAIVMVPAVAMAAAWSVAGAGLGSASATVLAAPAVTSSSSTATAATISVTAAPAAGPTPSSYRVDRTAPVAATSVCTISGATGSCSDTSPTPGVSNAYAVFSRVGSAWVAATAATTSVTVPAAAVLSVSTPDLEAASDSGSSSSDNYTNVTTPTFTGTATAGASVSILDGATVVGIGTATVGGTYSITVTALSGGAGAVHVMTASATLAAATASSPSALTVTVDTVAPAGLITSCAFERNGSNYTCSGVAGNATGDSAVVTLTIRNGSTTAWGPVSITRSGSAWTYSDSALGNNIDYIGTIVQADLAGNSSSAASAVFRR